MNSQKHNDIINFGKMHKTNLSFTILGVKWVRIVLLAWLYIIQYCQSLEYI